MACLASFENVLFLWFFSACASQAGERGEEENHETINAHFEGNFAPKAMLCCSFYEVFFGGLIYILSEYNFLSFEKNKSEFYNIDLKTLLGWNAVLYSRTQQHKKRKNYVKKILRGKYYEVSMSAELSLSSPSCSVAAEDEDAAPPPPSSSSSLVSMACSWWME